MAAILTPLIAAVIMGVLTIFSDMGQPFFSVLGHATSTAIASFAWTVVIEIVVGIFAAIAYPAWATGQHMFELFFG